MKRNLAIAAVGVLLLAVGYLGASWFIVSASLSAEAVPVEERPDAYGLAYEEIEFSPRGWPDITLRGWWIPVKNPKAIVIRVHGVDSNKGYRLALINALIENGYSVLTFDLRGHGESDKAAMGAGLHEIDDVLGAVDYVVAKREAQEAKEDKESAVFLHGLSFGAAIALMAGAEDPRIAGVFADSAFAALSDLVVQEVAGRTILPQWAAASLRPGIVWLSRAAKGIDLNEMAPESIMAAYDYPIALTHCRDDERIAIEHLARLRAALSQPPRMTIYEECAHGQAWNDYTDNYERFLLAYYEELLNPGTPPAN